MVVLAELLAGMALSHQTGTLSGVAQSNADWLVLVVRDKVGHAAFLMEKLPAG